LIDSGDRKADFGGGGKKSSSGLEEEMADMIDF
jgi:hypothetical protein